MMLRRIRCMTMPRLVELISAIQTASSVDKGQVGGAETVVTVYLDEKIVCDDQAYFDNQSTVFLNDHIPNISPFIHFTLKF